MWPPPKREAPPLPPTPAARPATIPAVTGHGAAAPAKGSPALQALWVLAAAAIGIGLGMTAPESFLSHLTVFVLACVVGWQVVWNVTPALHTPLMSVTNAISGIIIIGGMLQVSGPLTSPATILGGIAILLAMVNVSGGFLVTQRMLKMFSR